MRQADTYSSHQDARWKRAGRDSDSATTCGHCVQALKNSALCCAELACNPTRTLARGFERSCMSARQIKPRLTQLLRLSWLGVAYIVTSVEFHAIAIQYQQSAQPAAGCFALRLRSRAEATRQVADATWAAVLRITRSGSAARSGADKTNGERVRAAGQNRALGAWHTQTGTVHANIRVGRKVLPRG